MSYPRVMLLASALAGAIAFVPMWSAMPAVAAPHAAGDTTDNGRAPAATGIEWHVAPAGVVIFLDGKKLGEAGSLKFTKTTPGRHTVRLVNGEDETEMDIGIKKGQRLKFEFVFDDS